MCGIVGEYRFDRNNVKNENIQNMIDAIIHRGPDYGKIYGGA